MAKPPATVEERKSLEESGSRLLFRVSRLPARERAQAVQEVRDKAIEMRDVSAAEELARFVDRARLIYGGDVLLHTLGAQALVNLKLPLAARDLLRTARADPTDAKAWWEHQGLLGRVNKQAFVDAPDRSSPEARAALLESIEAYQTVYAADPKQYWHGINLSALLALPETGKGGESREIASEVLNQLEMPDGPARDQWWYATRAEALLALGREEEFAAALNDFLKSSPSHFALNSLHRQLCELWHLDWPHGPLGGRGLAPLGVLRAAMLEKRDIQSISVPAASVGAERAASAEEEKALEKTFGPSGPRRLRWWELGLKRARSVAAIYGPDGAGSHRRWGTGFLVSAKASGGDPAQRYVLTNAHVIGDGVHGGMTKETQARVRFEGVEEAKDHHVAKIVWTSPVEELDATLLRLESLPEGLEALPLITDLPARKPPALLYIIGHPQGDELSFSFQDNVLLDHEGPTEGKPRREDVCLVHYRTPSEPGSSGSPVFVADEWRVVALHHSGRSDMPKLNGQTGTYEANEGIALSSIAHALRSARAIDLDIS